MLLHFHNVINYVNSSVNIQLHVTSTHNTFFITLKAPFHFKNSFRNELVSIFATAITINLFTKHSSFLIIILIVKEVPFLLFIFTLNKTFCFYYKIINNNKIK